MVSRPDGTTRSVLATATPIVLCYLLHRSGCVPLVGCVWNPVVLVRSIRALRTKNHWAIDRCDVALRVVGGTVVEALQILLRTWEDGSSEQATHDCQRRRYGDRAVGNLSCPAAVLHQL